MKEERNHISIGGASILFVLTVFSMTVFAILSFRASYHETKMSEKTKEAVTNYYTADAKAEETLMTIYELIASEENVNEALFEENLSEVKQVSYEHITHNLTYQVEIDYNKVIEVSLKLPELKGGQIQIKDWRMLADNQEDYEDIPGEQLWDGILDE